MRDGSGRQDQGGGLRGVLPGRRRADVGPAAPAANDTSGYSGSVQELPDTFSNSSGTRELPPATPAAVVFRLTLSAEAGQALLTAAFGGLAVVVAGWPPWTAAADVAAADAGEPAPAGAGRLPQPARASAHRANARGGTAAIGNVRSVLMGPPGTWWNESRAGLAGTLLPAPCAAPVPAPCASTLCQHRAGQAVTWYDAATAAQVVCTAGSFCGRAATARLRPA